MPHRTYQRYQRRCTAIGGLFAICYFNLPHSTGHAATDYILVHDLSRPSTVHTFGSTGAQISRRIPKLVAEVGCGTVPSKERGVDADRTFGKTPWIKVGMWDGLLVSVRRGGSGYRQS
jgi:hypothetical protein